ncbi:hypothetical protein JXA40_01450 [bacterium]|nr:hypothetical protein [candidate division CSSED10-310 bacterium]
MSGIIGIRREDKNPWETRVPMVPSDVRKLIRESGLRFVVQPALGHRAFPDEDYLQAGAAVDEDLSGCRAVLGVKEIPGDRLLEEKLYVFFAHVIKGQKYNMPMLKSLMEKKCSLIDYERIEEPSGRRLIFFGRYAGMAGMVETLHALGLRLNRSGLENPFSRIDQPFRYPSLDAIRDTVGQAGLDIERNGLPRGILPFICGFTGYGNVSKGAQEIFDLLPCREITPGELLAGRDRLMDDTRGIYKVVFAEKDMFQARDPSPLFELDHYFKNPGLYVSRFEDYLPDLDVLVNCIYWTRESPKLVTKEYIKRAFSAGKNPKLKVIGDISCDIEGSVEITVSATNVAKPFYVYDPIRDRASDDLSLAGPVVMAIDNLPCEIPREASTDFSGVLSRYIRDIAEYDVSRSLESQHLPYEIRNALIVHNGRLTDDYAYIERFMEKISKES